MKCFYHNDADGKCAGYWVSLNVGLHDSYKTYEFVEMDYSKKFPLESIREDEQVYIVDFSISPDEMTQLLNITKDITWIDHHKTAIEKYNDYPYEIRGIRYDGIAGCMLTYCYIHHMTQFGIGEIKPFDISMIEDAPLFTKLIADWDVWKFKYGNDTRNFITAFNAYDFDPDPKCKDWEMFYPFDKKELEDGGLIYQGQIMNKFRDGWAKSYCKSKGFITMFEGNKCFAMNLGSCNSEYFKSIDDGTYDILMPFCFDGNMWTVSLYSKTVDVSNIAKKYGGGGHAGASGFQCAELPFNKLA